MNYSFFFLSVSGLAATLIVVGLLKTQWTTEGNGSNVTTTTETSSQPTDILKRNFVKNEDPDTTTDSKSPTTEESTLSGSTTNESSSSPSGETTEGSTIIDLTTETSISISPSEETTDGSTSPATITEISSSQSPSTEVTEQSTTEEPSTLSSTEISSTVSTAETVVTTTEAISCIETKLTEETDRIKWQKGTDTCESWLIDLTGTCTGVDIIIEKISLNGDLNEYLMISPSKEKLQNEDNPIITWSLTSEKKFRIIDSGTAYMRLITSEKSTSGLFSITYDCYGKDSLTTTESTTVAATTGGPDGDAKITVYLKGKSQIQFYEDLETFETIISNMATKYCEAENISLQIQPMPNNTFFTYIGPCTVTWPYFDICVKVTLGIGLNTTENEYEMSKRSLEAMWTRYAETDLKDAQLSVYQVPDDNDTYLIGWVSVSFGVVILFIFFIGLMWYYQPFRVYKKMKNDEAADETPRVTEIYPNDSAILYEPGSIVDFLPPKSPGADSSTDDFRDVRSSIAQLDTIPRYGPPAGFGGAIHFFGKRPSERGFENLELVAQDGNGTNNNQPRTAADSKTKPLRTFGNYSDEEEVDTSKIKRISFYDPTQNHYQDEPMENRRISYTDIEKQQPKIGETPKNSFQHTFPGNTSPQKQENLYGTTSHNLYQDQPKGYENPAYIDDENGEEMKRTLPRNSMQRNRSNSLMQEKQWTFGKPTLILEEEEEDEHDRIDSFTTTNPLPTLNALAPVTDDMEKELMEQDEIKSDNGPGKQPRSSTGNQNIYDIPKFPVRRFSVEEDA